MQNKKTISNTKLTPSKKAITVEDIINDLSVKSTPIPIYLTNDYYASVKPNVKPNITSNIIEDLRKLAQFSKMRDDANVDIDDT